MALFTETSNQKISLFVVILSRYLILGGQSLQRAKEKLFVELLIMFHLRYLMVKLTIIKLTVGV
jgi:hypothetical protein